MVPPHWKIVLMGHDDADQGDVIAQDGEILGAWSCDEFRWYQFIPDGAAGPAVQAAGVGRFCFQITEWYEAREAAES